MGFIYISLSLGTMTNFISQFDILKIKKDKEYSFDDLPKDLKRNNNINDLIKLIIYLSFGLFCIFVIYMFYRRFECAKNLVYKQD